ncbi:MAG: PTS sugar transporter subunit IIC [Lachnospiraceae bacterium]|nr:PTS sugar transporter subunit IIC [Lachnospiraceae bacterium]
MIQAALLAVLVYWVLYWCETYLLSWQCLSRPIVVAPVMGLLLGDFQTGIVMGAALESIFMGISGIGGSVPADGASAAIIAVCYTVLTGTDMEAGLALAMPVGTVIANFGVFSGFLQPLWSALAPAWEKLAVSCNEKKFTGLNLLLSLVIEPIPSLLIIFVAIAFGVEGISGLLASCPAWIMTGLTASASMMVAVGFGILCSMIWSGKIGCFFFVGYVLAKCVGMDSLPIAILGASIAIIMFFNDKEFIDFKKQITQLAVSAGPAVTDDEEGFF